MPRQGQNCAFRDLNIEETALFLNKKGACFTLKGHFLLFKRALFTRRKKGTFHSEKGPFLGVGFFFFFFFFLGGGKCHPCPPPSGSAALDINHVKSTICMHTLFNNITSSDFFCLCLPEKSEGENFFFFFFMIINGTVLNISVPLDFNSTRLFMIVTLPNSVRFVLRHTVIQKPLHFFQLITQFAMHDTCSFIEIENPRYFTAWAFCPHYINVWQCFRRNLLLVLCLVSCLTEHKQDKNYRISKSQDSNVFSYGQHRRTEPVSLVCVCVCVCGGGGG